MNTWKEYYERMVKEMPMFDIELRENLPNRIRSKTWTAKNGVKFNVKWRATASCPTAYSENRIILSEIIATPKKNNFVQQEIDLKEVA
jgi:hypothetical protein